MQLGNQLPWSIQQWDEPKAGSLVVIRVKIQMGSKDNKLNGVNFFKNEQFIHSFDRYLLHALYVLCLVLGARESG